MAMRWLGMRAPGITWRDHALIFGVMRGPAPRIHASVEFQHGDRRTRPAKRRRCSKTMLRSRRTSVMDPSPYTIIRMPGSDASRPLFPDSGAKADIAGGP